MNKNVMIDHINGLVRNNIKSLMYQNMPHQWFYIISNNNKDK
jgi:hypothetical protein